MPAAPRGVRPRSEKAAERYARGEGNLQQLADRYGISRGSVWNAVKRRRQAAIAFAASEAKRRAREVSVTVAPQVEPWE